MASLETRAFEGLGQFIVALALLIFLPAWSLSFWQGWVYWAVFSVSCIAITLYFLKYDPKLIERRLKAGPGAEKEKAQKIIQLVTSILFILLFILSGIDQRMGLSDIATAFVFISDILVIVGFIIVFFVFKGNSYTSATIETEKEQTVISTGPYRVVRHPMYAGALLLLLFTPLALNSYLAEIPAVLLCIMIVIRLLDEEKFLLKNLKGYKEYCAKTHYHLIPYIW